jgi:hypothetical protein
MRTCTTGAFLVVVSGLMLSEGVSRGSAQGISGPNVVIQLRLTGDSTALPNIRSCLAAQLARLPDIEVASLPTDGVRFVLDIIAQRNGAATLTASLVGVETFPMEQYRPRIKEGVDGDALLKRLRYYTLLQLHEIVIGRSYRTLCEKIVQEFRNKVLLKEYTERND